MVPVNVTRKKITYRLLDKICDVANKKGGRPMKRKKSRKRDIIDGLLLCALIGVLITENRKWDRLREYQDAPVIVRHSKGIDLDDAMGEVDVALSYLPREVKEYYFGTGNEINLKTINEYGGEKWSVAFCEFEGDKFVKMEVLITEEVENEYVSIIHEFGHFFDNIMKSSASEEWSIICEKEMQHSLESIDEYFMTPAEFFAQEFAWNCLSDLEIGAAAKERCPKAQRYISDEIRKFEREYLYY